MDIASSKQVTRRFVMRMVDAPVRDASPSDPVWNGPALIHGSNRLAWALKERLQRCGLEVLHLPTGMDREAMLEALEEQFHKAIPHHLFLTHPFDADANQSIRYGEWTERRQQAMMSAFWLCQRWVQKSDEAGILQDASLLGFVRLGGQFGFKAH